MGQEIKSYTFALHPSIYLPCLTEIVPKMPRHNLSPSLIARFFHHECQRFLRYSATPPVDRRALGVPEAVEEQTPVSELLTKKGFSWEDEVIGKKIPGLVHSAPGSGAYHDRRFSAEESVTILSSMEPGSGAYQSTLIAPPSFYRRYGMDRDACSFHECRPDLIWCLRDGEQRLLRVIDLKATDSLKISHRIQVALYALILDAVMADAGIPGAADRGRAGVWLQDAETPGIVDIGTDIRVLEHFLARDLEPIMTLPPASLSWHLQPKCEQCPFFTSCMKEAEETGSVSLIPGLTAGAREFLRNGPGREGTSLNTLCDLESFLSSPGADEALESCGSLRGKGEFLRRQVRAVLSRRVVPLDGASPSLPVNESVGVMLTLQREPVGGRIYAMGFRRFKGKDVYGSPFMEWIGVASGEEKCRTVAGRFVRTLYKELTVLSEYNNERPSGEQKSLQTYVADRREYRLFLDLLRACAACPETADAATVLLEYYSGVPAGEENRMRKPAVILSEVITEYAAFPGPVFCRLPEALSAMTEPDSSSVRVPSDLFWPALNNGMKADAIYLAWYSGRIEAIQWIEDEIRRRLLTGSDLLAAVRERMTARRWPDRFHLPQSGRIVHQECADLISALRRDTIAAATEAQRLRCLPEREARSVGGRIGIRYLGGDAWDVLSSPDPAMLGQTNGLLNFLLVPDTPAGITAAQAFDDGLYASKTVPPGGEIRFAGITGIEESPGNVSRIHLATRMTGQQGAFSPGDGAILFPRATDFTTETIIGQLAEWDRQPDSDLLMLMRDPHRFARCEEPPAMPNDAVLSGFTESQKEAYRHILGNRLTLVWGPPGTGKTHFLAHAMLGLVSSSDGPVRIAVSALTHAAIENLLFELRNCTGSSMDLRFTIGKLDRTTTPKGRNLQVLSRDLLTAATRIPERFVLGGTALAFHKHRTYLPSFDMLILDEASQITFGELSLLLPLLKTGGKLILAGDDLQLPPISRTGDGGCPEKSDEVQESVFGWLRKRDREEPSSYTCQLLENWRMNATLSGFSAETLYGHGYRPTNSSVADRRIRLAPAPSSDPFIAQVVSPDHPLTVVVLEDVRASLKNSAEAGLVADIASVLRERMLAPEGDGVYTDSQAGDEEFWRRGLFIVSPHHAQIGAIRKELLQRRNWKSDPFVDTVDRMQGQQCEAVIVSYGVSDHETALKEAEFIYSRNRLNVSVTRARAKCIVFLPRPLLEPSFELLQNERAAEGFRHMLDLIAFCRTHGEEKTCTVERAGRVTMFRTGYRD